MSAPCPLPEEASPESFKREAVEQVIAGTPLRQVAQAIVVTEALLGKWESQYTQAGVDAVPIHGKQRSEAAEHNKLRYTLARAAMERDALKSGRHLLAGSDVRFRAFDALINRYPAAPLCRVLGVSQSRYYAWLKRPSSAGEIANHQLLR